MSTSDPQGPDVAAMEHAGMVPPGTTSAEAAEQGRVAESGQGEVPETAADVVSWISEADDDAERARRADAAEAAEAARAGDPRTTVIDAIARARGETS